mmetsp:Transcript_37872/g.88552  ORF Transcript_37872/g.88552 Transcript_37872/m.88552 type:complete len:289 (-) Transcript_37872:557-1423(-)
MPALSVEAPPSVSETTRDSARVRWRIAARGGDAKMRVSCPTAVGWELMNCRVSLSSQRLATQPAANDTVKGWGPLSIAKRRCTAASLSCSLPPRTQVTSRRSASRGKSSMSASSPTPLEMGSAGLATGDVTAPDAWGCCGERTPRVSRTCSNSFCPWKSSSAKARLRPPTASIREPIFECLSDAPRSLPRMLLSSLRITSSARSDAARSSRSLSRASASRCWARRTRLSAATARSLTVSIPALSARRRSASRILSRRARDRVTSSSSSLLNSRTVSSRAFLEAISRSS